MSIFVRITGTRPCGPSVLCRAAWDFLPKGLKEWENMAASKINHKKKHVLKRELPLHMMLIPGIIFTFIFCYIPMAGMVIAFQKFIPAKGLFGDQKWIGLDNFTYLINMPGAMSALRNTVVIAFLKSYWGLWFLLRWRYCLMKCAPANSGEQYRLPFTFPISFPGWFLAAL